MSILSTIIYLQFIQNLDIGVRCKRFKELKTKGNKNSICSGNLKQYQFLKMKKWKYIRTNSKECEYIPFVTMWYDWNLILLSYS